MRYINSLPRPLLFKKGNGSAGRFLRKVHLIYVVFYFGLYIPLRSCPQNITVIPFSASTFRSVRTQNCAEKSLKK